MREEELCGPAAGGGGAPRRAPERGGGAPGASQRAEDLRGQRGWAARGRADGELRAHDILTERRRWDDKPGTEASGMERLLHCIFFCVVSLYLPIQFVLERLLELL